MPLNSHAVGTTGLAFAPSLGTSRPEDAKSTLSGVAEASTGVVVAGWLSSPANLGGQLLAPIGANDGVIAQYSSADGAHSYSSRFGASTPAGTGSLYSTLSTLDASDAPLVFGLSFCDAAGSPACSRIDIGTGGAVDPGGGPGADSFVGRYSITSGVPTWTARLVGAGEDHLTATSSGPSGTVLIAGYYEANTALISGADKRTFTAAGYRDILIAQLNSTTGQIGMATAFATSGFEHPTSVAWTGSEIVVAGFFNPMTTFGNITLTVAGAQPWDMFVAKLAPTDGSPVWAVSIGGPDQDKYPFIAVDSAGDIYLAGFITGSATIGGRTVGGAGGQDVVVVKLRNSNGSVVWAASFGSSGDDSASGIAVGPSGQIVVAADVSGALQPGGDWAGGQDAAFVSYTSDGTRLWTKVIGSNGTDYGGGIAAGRGAFYGAVNLGADVGSAVQGVPITGPAKPVGLLLRIEP